MITHVINHFRAAPAQTHLTASTWLSATLASRSDHVAQVIIADGSTQPDRDLQELVASDPKIEHVHSGHQLTFAEGYNLGLSSVKTEWVTLSASDVYPNDAFFSELVAEIAKADEKVGCFIPRLTQSDLQAQEPSRLFGRKTRRTPLMTLNLNAFRTRLIRDELGGVPTIYSGNYNDVHLSQQLCRRGLETVLLTTVVVHYGSLTLSSGTSNVRAEKDFAAFSERNPSSVKVESLWHVRPSTFVSAPLARTILQVSEAAPRSIRRRTVSHALRCLVNLGAIR